MKFRDLAIGLLVALTLWMASNPPLILAEEEEAAAPDVQAIDYACADRMQTEGAEILNGYLEVLDAFFKQELPTSELTPAALSYYRGLKAELDKIFIEETSVKRRRQTITSAVNVIELCSTIERDYLDFAYAAMRDFILSSGATKRNFKVVDGLREINKNLETLSDDFYATFPQSFVKFDNYLPCYPQQCVSK
jgi:hypothetical protein